MSSASAALPGFYDYSEVARSVLISIAASYAALELAGRVSATRGRVRSAWLSGGAIAMGIGIWAMHLKGMLAFHLPIPVEYHWPTVVVSLLVAILASAVALYVASRQKMGPVAAMTGSVVMGGAIAGMHYLGMAAMRLPAVMRYSPVLVTCSILLAVLFSLIALLMAFDLREETRWTAPRRVGSAIVMGAAVSAMHYTGMAAASFIPASLPDLSHAVNISPLGNSGIDLVTLIVIAAAIVTSSVDRRANLEFERLNQDLERRVLERTGQLTAVNVDLAETEERSRRLVEALPDAVFVVVQERFVFVNPSGVRLLGAERPEQIVGKELSQIIHPGSLESIRRRIRDSSRTGVPSPPKEHILLALDGSPVVVESASIPILWKGSPAIEAIARDITERKRAEEALRRSEAEARARAEELAVIFDAVPGMALISRDPACRNITGSRAAYQLLRLPYGANISKSAPEGERPSNFRLVRDGQELAPSELPLQKAAATGQEIRDSEYALLFDDGTTREIFGNAAPLLDYNGHVRGAMGVFVDISERKRAENSLRLFRMLVDQSSDAIEVIDPGTLRLIDINGRACTDLGYSREELLSMSVYDIDPNAESLRAKVTDELRSSGSAIFESVRRRKDGSTFPVEVSIKRVHLDRTYRVAVVRDITVRKLTEEALHEAQDKLAQVTRTQAMGELAAAIAHEVNQPLTAIVTNANFSLRHLKGSNPNLDELRAAIAEIVNDGTRASAVLSRIRGLLTKGTPRRSNLDINEIIQQVITLLRNELTRNRVNLRTELAPNLPRIAGDPVELQQVLINLIINALEAMRPATKQPRKLLIRSAENQDAVLVQVQDSGPGIEPELAGRIFEPFFTTKPEGTGMGLAISRSIVESHGGELSLVKDSRGALFQFVLPVERGEAA
jgi:PAS domain S-box-containing protein